MAPVRAGFVKHDRPAHPMSGVGTMPIETAFQSSETKPISAGVPHAWRTFRRGDMEWRMDPAVCGDWIDNNGELPISRWLMQGIAKTVKTGPHRTVYRLTLSAGSFFLKHYRTPDWQAVLQNMIRPCK